LSPASNWIGVQTGVHGFDFRTPYKPVVSKTSEADIQLSGYDRPTDVGGRRGGCQPGPHCSISEEFLHSIILRLKNHLGSWNLVNPLLSMNEAWMDECAARLQPLVDQYKPRQHQTFAIEKIPRFDRNNPIMSWGQKNLFN